MKFRVLSDSSCDITKEQEERYHIGIIPYYVSMDGVHYKKDRVGNHRGGILQGKWRKIRRLSKNLHPHADGSSIISFALCKGRRAGALFQSDCKIQQLLPEHYADCGGADGGIPCLQNHRS